jgi:hypothetical protein
LTNQNASTSTAGLTGWRKSSYSNASGACVEVRFDHDAVMVRDSKDRRSGQPVISVSRKEWIAFLSGMTPPGQRS